MSVPVAGRHYPNATADFAAWFRLHADYRDYLEWRSWPYGFVCTVDGCAGRGWAAGRQPVHVRRVRRGPRHGRHDLRPDPDPVDGLVPRLLDACHSEGRVSALSLQKALEISSYQAARAMLHRLRSVCVRPGRDRLIGTVEMDEPYIGGL